MKTAQKSGIEFAVNPTKGDTKSMVADITGKAGVDVVIDAAGFQPTRSSAMEIVNSGGTFMNIGLGIDETVLRMNHAIRNEIQILGSFCYSRKDFSDAVQLLSDGTIKETEWTEIRGLSEGQKSFEELVDGKVANGKIFLDPKI